MGLIDKEQQGIIIEERQPKKQALAVSQPQPVASVPQTSPMELLRIVTERGASADEISKFMDLMERQQAAEAKASFIRAMAAFKKNPPDIYKNKSVEFSGTSYMHATLGNICEQIICALAEHGISHDWSVEQPGNGMVRVICTLTHEQGHSKSTTLEAPPDSSGKKNAIQSIASTVTYLERYTLLAACGIAVKEQGDDDGRGAETPETPAPKHPISKKAFDKALDAIRAKTYTLEEIEAVYELTPDQREEAIKAASEAAQ